MTLESGSRLGPYEILAPVGAGGMGEVYKARDTRLERTVAVKVLPAHLSDSPGVRQRFEREARNDLAALASAHLRDLRRRAGRRDRVSRDGVHRRPDARGPPRQGPARPRPDAAVRRGDRGRARSRAPSGDRPPGPEARQRHADDLRDQAPRFRPREGLLSDHASGKSDRTAHAGEPDRGGNDPRNAPVHGAGAARGQRSRRADRHLRAGRGALRNGHRQEAIFRNESGVAHRSDPAHRARRRSPASNRCRRRARAGREALPRQAAGEALAKRPRSRARARGGAGKEAGTPASGAFPARRRLPEAAGWAAAAVLLAALLGSLLLRGHRGGPTPASRLRFAIAPPAEAAFQGMPAISPDGRKLAFVATTSDGRDLLFLRPLDSLEARRLEGTEGASYPFWSPDGRSIAFFAQGKLAKIDASGGSPNILCDAPNPRGRVLGLSRDDRLLRQRRRRDSPRGRERGDVPTTFRISSRTRRRRIAGRTSCRTEPIFSTSCSAGIRRPPARGWVPWNRKRRPVSPPPTEVACTPRRAFCSSEAATA